ncbi:MAG: hypothetical protein AAF998_19890 [Bacteroidota bacterium]
MSDTNISRAVTSQDFNNDSGKYQEILSLNREAPARVSYSATLSVPDTFNDTVGAGTEFEIRVLDSSDGSTKVIAQGVYTVAAKGQRIPTTLVAFFPGFQGATYTVQCFFRSFNGGTSTVVKGASLTLLQV